MLALLLAVPKIAASNDWAACGVCHPQITESYRRTGMGRSFFRATPHNTPELPEYYHAKSDRYFRVQRSGDRYTMLRWQKDSSKRKVNIVEKVIDYVLGSGNHARSYVSRTPDGRLLALPVSWYAGNGGYWAMAPGYDRPDHADLRREIGDDCMFCHNGYPEMATGSGSATAYRGRIPEGIDCVRCHGPGQAHVQAARSGATDHRVRAAIVNPRRLGHERQMEVCLQCHLQSTSRRLPYAIRRFGRGIFSYHPGEPLSEYMLHFKLAPDAGRPETFEVVHAGSRFLESACYLRSAGKLTCTTCHNPHDVPRGQAAREHYSQVCRSCHENPRHSERVPADCTSCHMPKRRTDDAVHVVMTDHLISRPSGANDLLAARHEMHEPEGNPYLGRVVPLYPRRLAGADVLYLAAAQVREGANLTEGIAQLQRELARYRPKTPEFYHELGEALRYAGRAREALAAYERAMERAPEFAPALRGLGMAYAVLGEPDRAVALLERALSLDRSSLETLNALGSTYQQRGRLAESTAALRKAIAVNPDAPEPHFNLAVALASSDDYEGAAAAMREAIRLRPDFAAAHSNLATLLERKGEFAAARGAHEQATRLRPGDADVRISYGLYLARRGEWLLARQHLGEAARITPSAATLTNLGTVLARMGDSAGALDQYRRALALDATFETARLNLARTLVGKGRNSEAVPHLRSLADSKVAEIRKAATELLELTDVP
jgi:predicted CXXCH cytochrome family protein